LEKIGVNPAKAVKIFVISHWHTDHIEGASDIAKKCEKSQICFSSAFLKEEFLTFADIYSGLNQTVVTDQDKSATREISSVISSIKKRCESNNNVLPYNLVSSDKRLYKKQFSSHSVEVWALSPSSESIANGLMEITGYIRKAKESKFRKVIPAPAANHNAVALLININEKPVILMGSDLENTNNPRTGWAAVVYSNARPIGKSHIFKIPHHGSKSAHFHEVWNKMLFPDTVGLLTPFTRSHLPKDSDIERLKKYTGHLYLTSKPKKNKTKYESSVEKTIKGLMKYRVVLRGDMGHIQLRFDSNSLDAKIGLNAHAFQL
jgi:hypothetical protein